jgi:S-adenosylmethionine-diacylglycerol 3-amino-3-carboxypropyl transferase
MSDWLSNRFFQIVHRHQLVYNTCWEDPRLDRAALGLGPGDRVLVITSAGCNVLDYALAGAGRIHAVDVNPRQNALLELKLAGIRRLEFEDFFAMFGRGRLDRAGDVYAGVLRRELSPPAQHYWDRRIEFFSPGNARPFYFRGASGTLAWILRAYARLRRMRGGLEAILEARTVAQQREIYDRDLYERFWSPWIRSFLRRDFVLSLAGVPRAQREQVDRAYPGGIAGFLHDSLEAVFARLPLADNYFWRVYIHGGYSRTCCPEYLKPENFARLKEGLIEGIEVHTASVEEFLQRHEQPITRFVLLDHMDWMSGRFLPLLAGEWQWIVRRAAPAARIIWRSGGLDSRFVDRLTVRLGTATRAVGDLLTYHADLARQLHAACRVHTYGSFHIADLAA